MASFTRAAMAPKSRCPNSYSRYSTSLSPRLGASSRVRVAMSEATHRLTRRVLARDIGPRKLRGLDELIRIYVVDQVLSSGRVLGSADVTPLFGREHELSILRSCFESASAGKGACLPPSGERGSGPSGRP